MCSLIATIEHKHLVKLLATYVYKEKYHLLFPFAESNLRAFWEAVPTPNWNRVTYLWVLDQIAGLASAMTAIHEYEANPAYTADPRKPGPVFSRFETAGRRAIPIAEGEGKYGRHGDMKPDNILWREDRENYGTLLITDLGMCDFHKASSVSKVPSNNLGGSQTYMAPELVLMKPISRAYDVWGLGCIYLEFITWLLTGFAGLEEFHRLRDNITLDPNVEDDSYFTLQLSGDGGKYATVRPAVEECIAMLRRNVKCSAMIRKILDLVEHSMLLVEPQKRIKARDLYSMLWRIHNDAKHDAEFLAGKRPENKGEGFIAPRFPTL